MLNNSLRISIQEYTVDGVSGVAGGGGGGGGGGGEGKEDEGGRMLILSVLKCYVPVDVRTVYNSVNCALQVSM